MAMFIQCSSCGHEVRTFPILISGPCLCLLDFFSGDVENGKISLTGINAAAATAAFNIASYSILEQ